MSHGLSVDLESDSAAWAGRLRLSKALFAPERDGFSSLAALPSNVQAIEFSLLFSSGIQSFVAIHGPTGWGKTHLLHAVAKVLRRRHSQTVKVVSALEWASNNPKWDTSAPIILDDAQDALMQVRSKQTLKLALEKRVISGRPTLVSFSADRSLRALKSFLPCQRDWVIGSIAEPNSRERELVVRQIASSKGVAVAPAIVTLLAKKTKGNGRSIDGALERLRLIQERWVCGDSVLKACGVLGPYLCDHNGWDLRDHVHEHICATADNWAERGSQVSWPRKLSVYIMLVDIGIAEKEVASYFKMTPGEAYACSQQVAALIGASPAREFYEACRTRLLHSIEQL